MFAEQSRLRGPQYPEPLEVAQQTAASQAASANLPARTLTTKFSTPNTTSARNHKESRTGTSSSGRGGPPQSNQHGQTRNPGLKMASRTSRPAIFNEDGSRNRARDIINGVNWNNGVGTSTRRPAERPEPHTSRKWLYSPSSVPAEGQ